MPDQTQNFFNSGKIFSKLGPANLGEEDERKKHMKTVTNIIFGAYAVVILAMGAVTANATPGDLYEADGGSGNIYKFTPSGTQSTFASGLGSVSGMAFDSAGNLYASSFYAGEILKFTPDGTQTTFASGLGSGTGGGVFDSAGNYYTGIDSDGTILKFTPGGT